MPAYYALKVSMNLANYALVFLSFMILPTFALTNLISVLPSIAVSSSFVSFMNGVAYGPAPSFLSSLSFFIITTFSFNFVFLLVKIQYTSDITTTVRSARPTTPITQFRF